MLLGPSSILDLHELNAPARNLCAKLLRVGTMQFTPFMLCYCWSASKILDVSAADHILSHTAELQRLARDSDVRKCSRDVTVV